MAQVKQHRNRKKPFEYSKKWSLRGVFLLAALFLYVPIVVLIIFSFNNSRRGGNVIWKGFTTKYYGKAFNNDDLMLAFGNTLTIAVVATIVSVVLGTCTAILLWRFRFPFKPLVVGLVSLPIVIPEICMGVSLAMFFTAIGWLGNTSDVWPLNLINVIIAHITFCFPFAAMVIRARLHSFNREMEEAARDLGATEYQVFKDILLPHLKPGLVAGALLSFTLSLDDFIVTFFTSGPNTVTLPVKIYSMVRFSVTPEINAASTVIVVLTLVLTVFALRFQNKDNAPQS